MVKTVCDLAHYIESGLGLGNATVDMYLIGVGDNSISAYDLVIEWMFDFNSRGLDYELRTDTYRYFALQNESKYKYDKTILIHNIIDYICFNMGINIKSIRYNWKNMLELLDYYFEFDFGFEPEFDTYDI